MKQTVRILSLLLALLMGLAFVSCTAKRPESPASDTTETDAATQEPPEEDTVKWIDVQSASGEPVSVFYPADATSDTVSSANQLALIIGTFLNKTVEAKPDTEIPEDVSAVILVGKTSHPASQKFYAEMHYSDYGNAVVENNALCVGGYLPVTTAKAVNALCKLMNARGLATEKTLKNGTTETGGYYLSSASDALTVGKYEVNSFEINGHPLSEFVLVCDDDAYSSSVLEMQARFGVSTGAYLPIVRSTAVTKNDCRILIGKTVESEINNFYKLPDYQTFKKFRVEIKGNVVSVLASGTYGVAAAESYLNAAYLGTGESSVSLTDSTYEGIVPGSLYGVEDCTVENTLRIFSQNVYFYNFSLNRAAIMMDNLMYLNADVLLLQEVSPVWHNYLDLNLPNLGYTQVPTKPAEDLGSVPQQQNYTPIFYRAEKLELIECGYDQLESVKLKPDKQHTTSKSYTWALFRELATGKQFVAISTHYTWAPDNFKPSPAELKKQDAQEVMALVKVLEDTYKVPVIVMGDLNSTTVTDAYKVMAAGNLEDAATHSESTANTDYNTYHNLDELPGKGSTALDHCFASKTGVRKCLFQSVVNSYAIHATDHLPIGLDFLLQ